AIVCLGENLTSLHHQRRNRHFTDRRCARGFFQCDSHEGYILIFYGCRHADDPLAGCCIRLSALWSVAREARDRPDPPDVRFGIRTSENLARQPSNVFPSRLSRESRLSRTATIGSRDTSVRSVAGGHLMARGL